MIPKCKRCGKEVNYRTVKYCDDCKIIVNMERNNKKYENVENCPTCKICGIKKKTLMGHIIKSHNMSISEYYIKFNCSVIDVICEETRQKLSESIKGEKNVWFNHKGKYSSWSKHSKAYSKLTEEEKENTAKDKRIKAMNNRIAIPTSLEYFLIKTEGNVEEALVLQKERQATGRLDKFIKRYGEEEGLNRWKARQEKWQNTLNAKPEEEKSRILRAKLCDGRGFSKISQELFWSIYEKIKYDFKSIYFAQLHQKNKIIDESGKNHEYILFYYDKVHSYFFDFFIKDIGRVIEFQGDYWHGRRGNLARDIERMKNVQKAGFSMLEIFEGQYRNNKQQEIQRCLDFIYG